MWSWKKGKTGAADNELGRPEQRRAERIETAVVGCALGSILEISRGGMSVCVQRLGGVAAGAELEIELTAPTDSMSVRARVIRTESLGGGRHRVAFEFVGMTDEDRSTVENLGRHGKRRAPGAFATREGRQRLVDALSMPDHYAVLGLRPGATDEEIQKAYRALARKYHPDVCRDEGALQLFCRINDAHETLGDGARREAYDEMYALRRAA
jgi:hypothetical protein